MDKKKQQRQAHLSIAPTFFVAMLAVIGTMLAMLIMAWKAYGDQQQVAKQQLLSEIHLVANVLPKDNLSAFAGRKSAVVFFSPEVGLSESLATYIGVSKPVLLSKSKVIELGWQAYGFENAILVTGVSTNNSFLAAIEVNKNAIIKRFTLAGVYLSLFIVALIISYSLWEKAKIRRRLRYISQAANAIVDGHLDKRIPINPAIQDAYSEVSSTLNGMLDKNAQLMHDLRQVNNNIAHDLKSPLNRIRSRLEVALLGERSEHDYRQIMADSIEDIDGLLKTFQSLLLMGNLEANARDFQLEKVSLSKLLENIAELYQAAAEEKQQTFRSSIADDIYVLANPTLFTQAIGNVLENAIKYTPKAGCIELSLIALSGTVLITISDNGPGIPDDKREKVFERFERLDSARKSPGVGLGMSLVRAILNVHNANIRLRDNASGLVVEIRLRKL